MHKRVIALDVHQARITACAVVEHDDGQVEVTKCEFGAFKRDRRALAQWSLQIRPEEVVMESTGVYWKSPFAALEAVGTVVWVVNARHVKAVPGRKTEMADAQWLVTLARAGLLRASFIPPLEFRQLRLVARQRQWHVGICSAEKNRLHKVLVDADRRGHGGVHAKTHRINTIPAQPLQSHALASFRPGPRTPASGCLPR